MNKASAKLAFFRQSSWMLFATVTSGALTTLVHPVAARMETSEYGAFYALLRALIVLNIPATGLQWIFAQQAATAVDEKRRAQLAATFRGAEMAVILIWGVMLTTVWVTRGQIVTALKLHNESVLWVTMAMALMSLCLPAVQGVLQGSQDFYGLGCVAMLGGIGRFTAIVLIVGILHKQSTGAMCAVACGHFLALSAGILWTRHVWWHEGLSPEWRKSIARAVPLTLGFGSLLLLSAADSVFVKAVFAKDDAAYYAPCQMVGFAIIQLTVPVSQVMFATIVRSLAEGQKSNALALALLCAGGVGGAAALGATLFPELFLRVLYFTKPEFWSMWPLVPWFAWCMLILTLANVLLSDLLARERYCVVPCLVLVVVGYVATLFVLREHLLVLPRNAAYALIVRLLMGFNLAVFAVTVGFSWENIQFLLRAIRRPSGQLGPPRC